MPKDPKSKKVSKAKAAKNTVDVEIAAEVVDDSKPKLKKGKKYFIKVRAYKKVQKKTVYGKYSNIKKVNIKK